MLFSSVVIIVRDISCSTFPASLNVLCPYINPPPDKVVIPISLNYPDSLTLTGKTGILISYVLVANSTIAQGTDVNLTDPWGAIYNTTEYANVSFVVSGFVETVPPNFTVQPGTVPYGGLIAGTVTYGRNVAHPNVLHPTENATTFKWLTSGDYSPSIFIYFLNNTSQDYTYSEIKVHVASPIEIKSFTNSNVEAALTYALVIVGGLEAFSIVHDLVDGDHKSNPTDEKPFSASNILFYSVLFSSLFYLLHRMINNRQDQPNHPNIKTEKSKRT
jgi:hypothetical protein